MRRALADPLRPHPAALALAAAGAIDPDDETRDLLALVDDRGLRRRTARNRLHSASSVSSSHSTGTSGKRSRCTLSARAPGTYRHASSEVNVRIGAIIRASARKMSWHVVWAARRRGSVGADV